MSVATDGKEEHLSCVVDTPVSVNGRELLLAAPPSTSRFGANNFDLIRMLLAIGVMCSHLYKLSRQEMYAGLSTLVSSTVLVQSFFVISGFLIFMSYEKSKSTRDYFERRLRRIYPAYGTVILVCAVAGLFLTTLRWSDYLSLDTLKYLGSNLFFLVFLQPELPGVFGGNAIHAVNGSLWTLKVEVSFYVAVPLIVWLMRRIHRGAVLSLVYVVSLIYSSVLLRHGQQELAKQLPGQMCFFAAGAALYYYFVEFSRWAGLLFGGAVGICLLNHYLSVAWIMPISVAVVTVFVAYCVPIVSGAGKFGDLSYGVYIYHFPVIQTLAQCGVYHRGPWVGLFLTFGLTLGLAFVSWHLVEKRFLRRASHYRRVSPENPLGVPV